MSLITKFKFKRPDKIPPDDGGFSLVKMKLEKEIITKQNKMKKILQKLNTKNKITNIKSFGSALVLFFVIFSFFPQGIFAATWTQRTITGVDTFSRITSTADGTKLAAADIWGSYIWTSTDSGATWTKRIPVAGKYWRYVNYSPNGAKLIATTSASSSYISTDFGATWTLSGIGACKIAFSTDGTKMAMVYCLSDTDIYTSTDSGATWTDRTSAGYRNWFDIASSSDGTKLVAVVQGGPIYTSTDSGATWTARTGSGAWTSVASSSDGTKLIAGLTGNGYIYTSNNSGEMATAF